MGDLGFTTTALYCYGIHVDVEGDLQDFWEGIQSDFPIPKEEANLNNGFLDIEMPCGEVFRYETARDVPLTNVPCTCGDPTHYAIYYGEILE